MMKIKSVLLILSLAILSGELEISLATSDPDVLSFVLGKGQEFQQAGTNAPVLIISSNSPFRFFSSVEPSSPGSVIGATLRVPSNKTNIFTDVGDAFEFEQGFSTKTLLDRAFTSGQYYFAIATLNGLHSPTLNLPKDMYPPTPRISNLIDLQEVEAGLPSAVEWDVFIGGSTNDFVLLQIDTVHGDPIFSTPAMLEPDALDALIYSFVVPANTLVPNSNYVGQLLFVKETSRNTTNYSGAVGISGFYKQTSFPISTLPVPPDEGRIQFNASAYNVNENNASATVTLTRSGTIGEVSVMVFTSSGTATNGLDYMENFTTVTLNDGVSSSDFTFAILDDFLLEGNETVHVSLSNPTGGAILGNRSNAVVTIIDNESTPAGILQFRPTSIVVAESARTAKFIVTRTGGKLGAVSVDFVVRAGTALAGSDFVATNGTLVFNNNQLSAMIVVPLLDDVLDEPNETLQVVLSSPTGGAALGPNIVGTATIIDDDVAGLISFSSPAYTVNENVSEALIRVNRTGGKAGNVTVDFTTENSTALAGSDYTFMSGTLTFGANESSATFLVRINNDLLAEGNETFSLKLSNPTGGALLGKTIHSTVTIVDDESSVAFAKPTYSVGEARPSVTIAVVRSGARNTPVTVEYATQDGSAVSPSDYNDRNGIIIFPPNVVSKTINIPIVNDTVVDGDKEFSLVLKNPTGGTRLGTVDTTVVTILDDDATVAVSATDASEPDSPGTFTFTRNGATSGALTVNFKVGGTATSGMDYTAIGSTLIFPAGAATAIKKVTVIDDNQLENPETVEVTLVKGIGYTVGSPSTAIATVTIGDDDAEVTVIASDPTAGEPGSGEDTGTFTFTRIGNTAVPLSLNYVVQGQATSAIDYDAIGTTVTFLPGETSRSKTVRVIDDISIEVSETVDVTLNPGKGYTRKLPFTATVTILDDDAEVTVIASDPTAGEPGSGQGTGTFTFKRRGDTDRPLTVNYMVGGTATSPQDYNTIGTAVTFSAGSPTATQVVEVNDDSEAEADETVTVALADGAGYTIGASRSATVTIKNDDRPEITVVATDPIAGEPQTGEGTGRWMFSRSGPTTAALTVKCTIGGSGISGTDYKLFQTAIHFPVGEATVGQTLFVTDDTNVEEDETIVVTLVGGPAYTVGSPFSATVTIKDDDAVVTVTATDATAGEPATDQGMGTFTFTRTGYIGSALTVNFSVGGAATIGTDYTSLGLTVTFSPGSGTATSTVSVVDDNLVEDAETVLVTLANGTGYTVGSVSVATVTINDDDAVVAVAASDPTASEPGGNQGTGTFIFTRSGYIDSALTVNFTVGGTATSGTDYTSLGTTVTFPTGSETATKTVSAIADVATEATETVRVTVANGPGYSVGSPSSATVNILNAVVPSAVIIQVQNFSDAEFGYDLRLMRLYANGLYTTEVNQSVYIEVFKLPRFAVNIVGQWVRFGELPPFRRWSNGKDVTLKSELPPSGFRITGEYYDLHYGTEQNPYVSIEPE